MPTKKDKLPQFPFTHFELTVHRLFIAIHLTLITLIAIKQGQKYSAHNLQPSWLTYLTGWQRDTHDIQWQTYRGNLPIQLAVIAGWSLVSRVIEKTQNDKMWVLGGGMLLYCLRSDLLLFIAVIGGWFFWAHLCHRWKHYQLGSWIIVLGLLYVNQLTNHLQWLSLEIGNWMPIQWLNSEHRQISFGQVLNLTTLKMLSFAIDLSRKDESKALEKQLQKSRHNQHEKSKQPVLSLKARNMVDTDDYSWSSYTQYLLFAPTLLTGPPTPYKNFISFRRHPAQKLPSGLNILILLLSFEIYQHLCPVVALNPAQSFAQASVSALFHLIFIWYKFLIIWRVARWWAGLCGVQVVDNLSRCVCNNYNFTGFWRMWHRGFNQWLIRYLYIPLGGNTNPLSVVATVAFVAFWHDHSLNIVLWAMALVVFILPQIYLKSYFAKHHPEWFGTHWFKYICAGAAALYIYLLVFSNIIGFGSEGQGVMEVISKIAAQWVSVLWSWIVLSSAVILMFYWRAVDPDEDKNY